MCFCGHISRHNVRNHLPYRRETETERVVETYMHEEPLVDAAKRREGRVVGNVMHHVKYQGINCLSTFTVFVAFRSLESAISSYIMHVLLFMSFGNCLLVLSFIHQTVYPLSCQMCSFWGML